MNNNAVDIITFKSAFFKSERSHDQKRTRQNVRFPVGYYIVLRSLRVLPTGVSLHGFYLLIAQSR